MDLVLKPLATYLISLSTVQACADMSVARCHVVDGQGAELLALKPLYPVRHWSRYRINQDRFVDLRYDYFTSSVLVRTTSVPHYPWTFSETTLDEDTLRMSGGTAPSGMLAIDHTQWGAQVSCQEGKAT